MFDFYPNQVRDVVSAARGRGVDVKIWPSRMVDDHGYMVGLRCGDLVWKDFVAAFPEEGFQQRLERSVRAGEQRMEALRHGD